MKLMIQSSLETAPPPPMHDRRIHEIDGLRGWASLSVVSFHFVAETFGHVHPEFLSGYLKLLLDGPLAVYVFFVLSGDSLASAVLAEPNLKSWTHIVAKRYLRLTLPIVASTLLTLCVMKFGWIYSFQASQIVHREDWLGTFLQFEGTTNTALKYAVAGVYGWIGVPVYNTFLWSIAVEWTGSVLVLLSTPVLKNARYPEIFTLVIAMYALWLTDYLAMFVIGIFLSLARRRGLIKAARSSVFWQFMSLIILVAVYFVDLRRQSYPMPSSKTLLNMGEIFWRNNFFNVSAPLIVIGVYVNKKAVSFMRSGLSMFLGRVSFNLYIIQFVVLCSLYSFIITRFAEEINNIGFAVVISLSSVLFCIAISWPLSLFEAKMLRVVGRFANLVLGPSRG